jgi:hypothetical protein
LLLAPFELTGHAIQSPVDRGAKPLQHEAAHRQADVALTAATVNMRFGLATRQCCGSVLDDELLSLIAHMTPELFTRANWLP